MVKHFFAAATTGALASLWIYRLMLLWGHPALAGAVVVSALLSAQVLGRARSSRLTDCLAWNTVWAALTFPLFMLLDASRLELPFEVGLVWLALLLLGAGLGLAKPVKPGAVCLGLLTGGAACAGSLEEVGLTAWLAGTASLLLVWAILSALRPEPRVEANPSPQTAPSISTILALLAWALWAAGWQRLYEIAWGSSVAALVLIYGLGLAGVAAGVAFRLFNPKEALLPTWSLLALALSGLITWQAVPLAPAAQAGLGVGLSSFFLGVNLISAPALGWGGLAYLAATATDLKFILPRWGLEFSWTLASALAVLAAWIALAQAWAESGESKIQRILLAVLLFLALPALGILPAGRLARSESDCAFHKDGSWATVLVRFPASGDPQTSYNGSGFSSSAAAALSQRNGERLLGYLPSFYHLKPSSALLLGAGGPTLGSLSNDLRLQNIDWVSPEAQAPEAAEYAKGYERLPSEDDRIHFHAHPLVSFLKNAPTYDFIACDPESAGMRGVGELWSADFYRICLAHLEPKSGLFIQRLDIENFSPRAFASLLRGLFEVFPNAEIWQVSESQLAVLASPAPLQYHVEQLLAMWHQQPGVRQDFIAMNILDPAHIQGYRVLPREALLRAVEKNRLITLDHPLFAWQEPLAPIYLERMVSWMHGMHGKGSKLMLNTAPAWFNVGDLENATSLLEQAPDTPIKSAYQIRIDLAQGKTPDVSKALKAWPQDYYVHFAAALAAIARQAWPEAIDDLKVCQAHSQEQGGPVEPPPPAVAADPSAGPRMAQSNGWEYPALSALAYCYESSGQFAQAAECYERATELSSLSDPLRGLGRCLLRDKQLPIAQHVLIRAVQRNPADYVAWSYLGQVRILAKQFDKAEEALHSALQLAPADHDSRLNLAIAYQEQGHRAKALNELNRLLRFYPGDKQALEMRSKI